MVELLRNLVLLSVTAALSGLLIPYVLKIIDHRKQREQIELEAQLARQGKIIEAQVALLDAFSEKVWEFQLYLISVSYYQDWKGDTTDRFAEAIDRYHRNSDRLIAEIRAEISKSIRLASVSLYEKLKKVFYEDLMTADQNLRGLLESRTASEPSSSGWMRFNAFLVEDLSERVDSVIKAMAEEFQLTGSNVERRG